MTNGSGIWFVYRSHYDGPLSKRVRRLKASSVLGWFQEKFEVARTAGEPRKVADHELGGYVYGFGTIFEAVKQHGLPCPRSVPALAKLLRKHLYVEGGRDHIRLDEHTLRVLTDDDEVQLAYFFFDDHAARAHPDRVAYLLTEDPRLPDGKGSGTFVPPVKPDALLPGGGGEGITYACLLTFYDSASMPGEAVAFPGVRLPELAVHFRRIIPESAPAPWSEEWLETWPLELRLLRAMLEPEDRTIGPALARVQAYPLDTLGSATNHSHLGVGRYETARREFLKAGKTFRHQGDPSCSIVHEGEHVAILCAHTSSHFGYQQWIFFDDRWASTWPELAASILRYATQWDPFPKKPSRGRKGDL
jgi:hypothetical protein